MYDVKRGDVWQLGRHRLMCGSSARHKDVSTLFAGATADCVFTSPPYANQRVYPDSIDSWDAMMASVSNLMPVHNRTQVFVNIGIFYRAGHCVYYWHDWLMSMNAYGWKHTGWYIWDKLAGLPTVPARGRLYPSHEFVFHFCKLPVVPNKTAPCVSKGKTNKRPGMRRPTSVVYKRPKAANLVCSDTRIADSVFRMTARGNSGASKHPAMFPTGLPQNYIEAFTQKGAIVYDPFCGSGTTLIAAEQTERVGYSMEIAPEYVQMSIERWVKIYPEQQPLRVLHGDC